MIKNIISLFLFKILFTNILYSQKSFKTIIIDPGHGKPDIGARGKFSTESQVTLAFALKLAEKIKKNFPDINIIMTRQDEYLPDRLNNSADASRLRANIANENKGDLFISIHADSEAQKYKRIYIGNRDRKITLKDKKGKKTTKIINEKVFKKIPLQHKAKGSSFYIIASHKNKDKNASILENLDMLNDDSSENQIEFNTPELTAMASIWQKKFFKKSYLFASLINEEFKRKNRFTLGVKQRSKGIWVLQATSMPSVLVETGYICTEDEEIYLNSDEGQNELMDALVEALKKYKLLIETNIYIIPKEMMAKEVENKQIEENILPIERDAKIFKTITTSSNNIDIEIINLNENDESKYTILDNIIFVENKKIKSDTAVIFTLNIEGIDEIDFNIMAEKLIERKTGELLIKINDGKNKYEVPVAVSNIENAFIVIKKKIQNNFKNK